MIPKIITYKLVTYKNGKCALFKGKKKLVQHSGKDAEDLCRRASKSDADMIALMRGLKKKR